MGGGQRAQHGAANFTAAFLNEAVVLVPEASADRPNAPFPFVKAARAAKIGPLSALPISIG